MKSVCKKSLSVILAVLMTFTIVISATAGISYEDKKNPTTITGYSDVLNDNFKEIYQVKEDGKVTLIIIDSYIKGTENVEFDAVADKAFSYDKNESEKAYLNDVTEIVVRSGIKFIGKNAFANLPKLEKITFEGNDIVLGNNALEDCQALKTVVFAKDASIGDDAFKGCTALETFDVKDDGKFAVEKNAIADTAYYKSFDVDFITLGSTLIEYKGGDDFVTIPLNVATIGNSAFKGNTALKGVKITKFVKNIGNEAFMDCVNLKNVIYSNYGDIEQVGTDVFTNTYYFNNFDGDFFTIGTYLIKYLGDDAYVSIPNTITKIAPGCFEGCYTTTANGGHTYVVSAIYVSASVKQFGDNCFGLEKLEDGSYYIPRIYAYSKTDTNSMELLKDAGYNPAVMPAPADVDANGAVEAADARIALRISVKLTVGVEPIIYRAANVNGDKLVTADDARTILRLSVGLENYTAEDLLYKPTTDFEILQAYTESIKTIAKYTAGYTKDITNTPGASDMSFNANLYLLDTLEKKGYTNSTTVYDADTTAALENIDFCSLVSTKSIKDATCVLDVDDNYVITIKFADTLDNSANSDITKVFPAKSRDFYLDQFKNQYWWDLSLTDITQFDLIYTAPTVTLTLNKDDLKVIDCELALGYHFEIAGKINGLSVCAKKDGDKPATFDRLDIVKYSDFVY